MEENVIPISKAPVYELTALLTEGRTITAEINGSNLESIKGHFYSGCTDHIPFLARDGSWYAINRIETLAIIAVKKND